MQDWIVPAVLGALALLALVLAVVLLLGRARTDRELRAAHAEVASLRARLEDVAQQLAEPARGPARPADDAPDYVITHLGEEIRPPRHASAPDGAAVARVEPALFADLVLRETVVKAASLAHGLRVALAPETRNRIRFEVRREVRRSRKQRRAELKEARRQYDARQRAALPDDEDAA